MRQLLKEPRLKRQLVILPKTWIFLFYDLFLGFLAGFFQIGFGFILITIGAKTTPSAMVGIIMLTEAVFGPLWAWIFANENPPFLVILGGCIIILAVFLQFFSKLEKVKKI